MRWYFSLGVLCVKEREHWYSGISSEFIIHNTRVIGLQIASKETWTRSLYCIFGVIGDVKCTWLESKEKVHTTCSVSHWKFLRIDHYVIHWLTERSHSKAPTGGSSSAKWGRTPAELILEPMLGLASPHIHGSLLPASDPRFPAGPPVELL